MSNTGAGKGDRYRAVNPDRWAENYYRIFGKKEKKTKTKKEKVNVKQIKRTRDDQTTSNKQDIITDATEGEGTQAGER